MNLKNLKLGFKEYLLKITTDQTKKAELEQRDDVSIFSHSDEFRDYVKDELGYESKNVYTSIEELLSLEFVDGKLVNPDEEIEQSTQEIAPVADTEEAQEIPDKEETQEVDTEGEEAPAEAVIEDAELSEEEMIQNVMNDLMSNDKFSEIVDRSADGEISDEELLAFYESISGYDGDMENISLDDIMSAGKEVNDGTFKFLDELDLDDSEEVKNEADDLKAKREAYKEKLLEDSKAEAQKAQEAIAAQQAAQAGGTGGAGGASGGGGVSGGGGSYGGGGGTGASGTGASDLTTQGTGAKTVEEIQKELDTAQTELDTKEENLTNVLNGSDEEIQGLQEDADEAYETYQEKLQEVDEDLAKDVDDKKQEIDTKEKEISDKDIEIADQESTISECETNYSNAQATTKNLETILQSLNSVDCGDDAEKKSNLEAQKKQVQSELEAAKTAEEEAKTALDDAKEKLTTLEGEKETLQGEADTLNEEMATLEAKVAEKYPEVQQYMDTYNEKKDLVTEKKETKATTAKEEVTTAQSKVNDLKTQLNEAKNAEKVKEYAFGEFGEDIVEFARSFLGCNEADGSANKFLGGQSAAAIPWCAAFVEYCMKNGGSYDQVPDWYKNVDNKWYCPNIYNAAKNAGAIINGQEAKPGDIVLFDWHGDGTRDHIGIVKSVSNGQVVVVEGNTSNKVAEKTYTVNDGRLTYCKVVS